ncbi:MAG: lactate utilization protein [Luteitalea sp.]|nr:lactate utilization protein [Luteitalea sp.]
MKPEDLAHMRSTLGRAIGRALLPGASPDGPSSARVSQGAERAAESPEELVSSFRRELEALAGVVHEVSGVEAARCRVREIARDQRATRVLSWEGQHLRVDGLLGDLEGDGLQVMTGPVPSETEARAASLATLERAELGLTGADAGLADTGSIVVRSGPGRLRLASLLPPVHVALLPRSGLWPSLTAWLAEESSTVQDVSNLVIITGPSRTADIEMTLSRGVHGPGELHVVLY